MPRLIAAAHASCFAMALALVLDENKTPPERVAVSAACTLGEVEGAPRITTVELTARAQVHGLEAAAFEQMVGRAADLCPVSNALRGNVEISVRSSSPRAQRPPPSAARARPLPAPNPAHPTVDRRPKSSTSLGAERAVARAVSSGRVRQLGDDLYEIAEPPNR